MRQSVSPSLVKQKVFYFGNVENKNRDTILTFCVPSSSNRHLFPVHFQSNEPEVDSGIQVLGRQLRRSRCKQMITDWVRGGKVPLVVLPAPVVGLLCGPFALLAHALLQKS